MLFSLHLSFFSFSSSPPPPDYSCALQRDILLQGRLYLSENWICFYSNIFRWETLVGSDNRRLAGSPAPVWKLHVFCCWCAANGAAKGHLLHDEGEDGPPHPQRHPGVHGH